MCVTAILTETERKRQDSSVTALNERAMLGQEDAGSAARSRPDQGACAETTDIRSGRKRLIKGQKIKAILNVRRQATWGMSAT